jgi:AcrR family transcriptional regulator
VSTVDGRTARAERTRAAIVSAHLALITEGDLKPTGERIAQRAGVSLRALWANFKDMEALFAATGALLAHRQAAAHRPVPADQPLADRLDQYCRQRGRMLEIVAPSARASQLREPFSPQLRRNRAAAVAKVRSELEEVFAPELAVAGPGRDRLLDALTATCTWPAWSLLRDQLALDADEACAVMRHTVTALLTTAIAAGLGS